MEGNDNEFEEDDENPDDESDDYNSQHHSVSTSSEEKSQEVRRELKNDYCLNTCFTPVNFFLLDFLLMKAEQKNRATRLALKLFKLML